MCRENPEMKILVCSCDKNADTWEPFYHCMEKYWPDHPEVLYLTETIDNRHYRTFKENFPIDQWTWRVQRMLRKVDTDKVLLMMDDCFIRRPVDTEKLEYAMSFLNGNVANVNLERSWDEHDEPYAEGIKKRRHGAMYEVSIMCGIWQTWCLDLIMAGNHSPWEVEASQDNCGFDFLITTDGNVIDFGYARTWVPFGISRGKWCREVVPFFEHEGIQVDYSKRGMW